MTTLALQTTTLYRFFDANGVLLYVGISNDPAKRAREHMLSKEWWPAVASTTSEEYPDRHTAAASEQAAIRNERPVHNVARRGVRLAPRAQGKPRPIPREVDDLLANLADSGDVADMLGLSSGSKGLASYLRDCPDFPAPVKVSSSGRGRWWYAPHILQWRQMHPARKRNQ